MEVSNQQGIEEVFVIKTGEIDFFGALIKENGGRSAVNGKVRFRDGSSLYFRGPNGERNGLRKNLLSLCQAIAQFYDTNVFWLRFQKVMGYDDFIRLLRETHQKMGYA